ncbi:MAG: glycosyltransferase family 39 protein, partial [Acidobacteria bacterium]|nr:glycosyltransferase family 39 protein [Acidobacteriota bacterium]
LRLPYFWDEAGYYIPAARDLSQGFLIPHSTPSNAHPPLVLAWLALCWKGFGQSPLVTRSAMLALAAFSLLGVFQLAAAVSNYRVATATTLLTALYPVFFAQSSLALVDLPAAGFTFWALKAYTERRSLQEALWFGIAALAKETAIVVPLALCVWQLLATRVAVKKIWPRIERFGIGNRSSLLALIVPVVPLTVWYAYHYARTGFVFGNPEFFAYNVQATLHPLRILLALLLRIWQTIGYPNLYVLTGAALLAMKFPAIEDSEGRRPRIELFFQASFLAVAALYVVVLSVLGGAVLARYMLPVVPLVVLVCVSTVWRRLRPWHVIIAIVALAFVGALFVNPPYGFSPEDNLAYGDYVRLHKRAEAWLETKYPHARVLTAWPASDELSRPYLGYVDEPVPVVRIDDFTAEQLLSAADAKVHFDVALVFSTKYQAPRSLFDRWHRWQEWKTRYFGYHIDLTPEVAASILGGTLVFVERRRGQWVGVIELPKIEEAQNNL